MDKSRRDQFKFYLRELADKMELRDWSISTPPETSPDGSAASVNCLIGRKIAVIRFSCDFDSYSRDQQRHFCVHELLHVHMWGVTQALRDARENSNKEWVRQLELRVHLSEEYGVDGIASIIAPGMPLPPKKKKAD